jgi:hypothetical protein
VPGSPCRPFPSIIECAEIIKASRPLIGIANVIRMLSPTIAVGDPASNSEPLWISALEGA